MTWIGRVLRLAAANGVPGGGLLVGWSPATALTLYWVDNLVGSFAMGVRIALHRRLTGASGHDRGQLGATSRTGSSAARPFRSFLAEFLVTSVAFTLVQGVFLAVLLGGVMDARPEGESLRQGALGIAGCHLLALASDAVTLRTWPFARVKEQATYAMGRVVVVHLVIIGGMAWLAASGSSTGVFAIFIVLKLLVDLGSMLPQIEPGGAPPRWLAALMKRVPTKTGETFEEYWRRTHAEELAQAARDELPVARGSERPRHR